MEGTVVGRHVTALPRQRGCPSLVILLAHGDQVVDTVTAPKKWQLICKKNMPLFLT